MTGAGVRFPALSEASRAALVRLLVHGPASRADLARQLRLSAATLTRISRSLEEGDLVRPAENSVPQRLGRPSQAMDVNVDAAHLIGIKLSAGDLNLVRTDMRSTVLNQRTVPLPSRDIQDVVDVIAAAIEAERAIDPSVAAAGLSLAGPVNPLAEIVAQSPFLGWEGIPLSRLVGSAPACRPSSRTTSVR